MTAVFVTGAGTDAGKTLVACALIAAARAAGQAVDAFKPVASGFDPHSPGTSDAGRLLAALGREVTPQAIDAISPLRFAAPLSPPDAARRAGIALSLHELEASCYVHMAAAPGLLLIEGAGGVMSPIADDGLNLDLVLALRLPVILCAANYLGAISHTLTALEVLKGRDIEVLAVILQDLQDGGPDLGDTAAAIERYAPGIAVLAGAGFAPALLRRVADG